MQWFLFQKWAGAAFLLLFAWQLNALEMTGESRVIGADGVEIEIFLYGDKGDETLIIAAGNARPAAQLDELATKISRSGIRVVTYNYRTIGASTGPRDALTLHDLADDVWRIADALSLEKVHLAGKTFGNRVMRTASSDYPERTLSIILIGAGGGMPDKEVQALYRRWADPDTPREEWQRLHGELMFAPGNEHLASRSAALGSYPAVAAAQGRAMRATPSQEWINGGGAPMLVLSCLHDRLAVPENALLFAKSRKDAQFVGIPGCAHNMIFERPDEIVQQMVAFIKKAK